ncbi:MAG: Phage tail protein, partial [Solirubrobacterales bacterium]|nr:Phage tail protein [Solirubrobacterales bacterium]
WAADDPAAAPPPLEDPAWAAAPLDAAAWRPDLGTAPLLWVGGRLQSGGAGGPVVRGLRVDFDHEGWLRHLPAIYAREGGALLEPVLALLEDSLREEEDLIDGLPRLFDPAATPAADLDWLAGWLAFDLDPALDEPARRAVLARAFELQGIRGTAAALRLAIELALGVRAEVLEPATHLRVWQLGEAGGLGMGSLLAAGEPDGAVLGATADLDRSSLDREEDFGAPIFDATAHRFCVRVYGADLAGDAGRATLARVIEQQRPAETEAHVCVIEPRLRVGFQATVGVDAIVGRGAEPMRLGEEGRLGAGAALRAGVRRQTVGDQTRLGRGPE